MTRSSRVALGDSRLPKRFWDKVELTDSGCWVWLAGVGHNGYGEFWFQGRTCHAHRVAVAVLVAPIADGLQIDHLCRVRACVNPDHLEPVTAMENMRRGFNAQKSHCVNGHAFTPENTLMRKGNDGRRSCRVCSRERMRQYRAARRAKR